MLNSYSSSVDENSSRESEAMCSSVMSVKYCPVPLRRILNAAPAPVGKLANKDAVDLASTAAKNRMKLVVLQQALSSDCNVPACFSTAWSLRHRCIDCKMSFPKIAYVFSMLPTCFCFASASDFQQKLSKHDIC